MLRKSSSIAVALAACSCTTSNIPLSTRFPAIVDRPAEARVFLDVNGTFYPDRWRARFPERAVARRGSLLNAASPVERDTIAVEDRRQLDALAAMIAGKARIFVLVHGYNIDEADAGLAFDMLERRIAFTKADAVIRLHWDGRLGTGIGAGSIWFPATGYSQVVGIRGLRRILDLPRDQDVYLISHSRGASVILSALGDPPFSPGFRRSTEALDFAGPAFLRQPALGDHGNRIRAILLGPAVGYPDFWDPSCEPARSGGKICSDPPEDPVAGERPCPEHRVFTPQLKSIRYTINDGDRTLKKLAFTLRRYFNATDLGVSAAVGERLHGCYPFMTGHTIVQKHGHAFTLYAQDPELADMLRAEGVEAE